MNGKKYIVFELEGVESIFTFPKTVDHDRMAEAVEAIRFGSSRNWTRAYREGEIISAGFVDNNKCHGGSETLDLKSRGEIDTKLLLG